MDDFKQLAQDLNLKLDGKVILNEPLFKYSTMCTGGEAAIYAVAESLKDLRVLLKLSQEKKIPYLMLGKGSNVLISDLGFKGIIIKLGTEFRGLKIESSVIEAGAATALATLVQTAFKHNLKGLAFAVGIPGTVGGAIRSNAGSFGSSISDALKSVTVYTPNLELRSYSRQDLDPKYRKSLVGEQEIVLEAVFHLALGDSISIKYEMERNFKKRKQDQPLGLANAGSIFKNPPGLYAAEIIDELGWKGRKAGSAQVSTKHANFIVNLGGASSSDVYRLIKMIHADVFAKKAIKLEPEIKFIGEF